MTAVRRKRPIRFSIFGDAVHWTSANPKILPTKFGDRKLRVYLQFFSRRMTAPAALCLALLLSGCGRSDCAESSPLIWVVVNGERYVLTETLSGAPVYGEKIKTTDQDDFRPNLTVLADPAYPQRIYVQHGGWMALEKAPLGEC